MRVKSRARASRSFFLGRFVSAKTEQSGSVFWLPKNNRNPKPTPYLSVGFVSLFPILVFFLLFAHFYFPASEQAVVTGVVPSTPRFLPSIFIAQRVQQSQCSSMFHRVLLTHALAFSASQFVRKKKVPTNYALGGIRTHETDLYQARG